MTVSNPSHGTPNPVAAYVCTDQGADIARSVVDTLIGDQSPLHGGGLGGAARVCRTPAPDRMVLAEMGNMTLEAACECVAEIRQTGAYVIVLGDKADLAIYRALRNAGAEEYFAFPVSPDEIIAANDNIKEPVQQPVQDTPIVRGTCIGVTGCNGGVGTSLLAQNLAFHSATANGGALQTALIDADLRFGSQAIDLDRKDTPGLFEALSAPDRVDETFLGATMEKLTDRLSFYSQQAHISQNVDALDAAFPPLLEEIKTKFDSVIVDLPRTTLVANPQFAHCLDTLVLVIPAGYAGVNVASRLMSVLKSEAPTLKILPVLSELRLDAKLTAKDISIGIGQEVQATLPESAKALSRAHRAAKSLIESQPRAPYAKATRALWAKAIQPPQDTAKISVAKSKMGFFKRATA
ncbi:AAA family ATPase [Sulfitobacter pacificus]|uniref:AAA family ATPase n=1 Tax=Sulfitobacter pacificus TaxID=1499314 RepID=UPI003104B554